MHSLPKHASLGLDNPQLRVLEWYLACTHAHEYDKLTNDLRRGVELMNPIPAFETMARRQNDGSYKETLDLAHNVLAGRPALAKEATRWLVRWEPELTRLVAQRLAGKDPLDERATWSAEKLIGYSLLVSHMCAVNWESPSLVHLWEDKTAYRADMTVEKRQQATARAYWKTLATVPDAWQPVVLQSMQMRTPERHRQSLEDAMDYVREKMVYTPDKETPAFSTKIPVRPE